MKTLALATLCVLLVGCTAQRAHPIGRIEVRNESPQSVRIEVDGLPNADRPVDWVPTWTAGWCPMAEIGFGDDGVANALQQAQIVLTGPTLAEPTSFPGTAADIPAGGLILTIDPNGAVEVSNEDISLPSGGCAFYPLDAQPR